jgi:2'-deoxynucleoside 5'-phosphate N-hydrolase
MRIFFGGPLTDLQEPDKTKQFYTELGNIAAQCGYEYYWAFQRGTDPEENPNVSPDRVFQIDTYELEKSDMMIAYVGEPSTGTGIEIEYARERNIPVYLLFEKGKKISRMLIGTPNIKGTLEYTTEEDAYTQLRLLLEKLKTQ